MTFRKLPATVDNMLKYLVKRYLKKIFNLDFLDGCVKF